MTIIRKKAKKVMQLQDREKRNIVIMAICLAFIFAAMLVTGYILDHGNEIASGYYLLGTIFLLTIPLFLIIYSITQKISQCPSVAAVSLTKRQLGKWYLIIIIVWILGYLAMYPGVYATDAPYWYYEFSNADVPISSQWSPVYAGAFYYFVEFGRRFLGSAVVGFGIFTFVQMSMVLYGVWKMVCFLNEKLGKFAAISGIIFFTIVPTHNILSVTSAQDSLFALSFAMCLMHLIEIVLDENTYFSGWKKPLSFAIWLTFSCVIRNNGLYAILVLAVFVVLFLRKNKVKVLSILLGVIALIMFYQGPIYSIMGVQKGTAVREMLSLPLQQMGFAYNYTNDIPDDVKEEMQNYISDEGWKTYEPCISDQIKSRLNTEIVKDNMGEFIKLYLKVGLKSPKGYVNGALYQTFGLWYPNKSYPDSRTWHPYMIYLSSDTYGLGFMIPRRSLFPAYDKMLGWLFGLGESQDGYGGNLFMGFSKVPVWSLLCKAGTYTWLLIYAFAYSITRRRWYALVPLGYLLGLFLTVFLSPVILYRYVAPLIFSGPLIAAILFLPVLRRNVE